MIIRQKVEFIFVAKHLYRSDIDIVCLDLLYTEGAQNSLSLVEKCERILPLINLKQVYVITQQSVLTKHFDWPRGIPGVLLYSMTAPGQEFMYHSFSHVF